MMRTISPGGGFLSFVLLLALSINGCAKSPAESATDSRMPGKSGASKSTVDSSEARLKSNTQPETEDVPDRTAQQEQSGTEPTPTLPVAPAPSIKLISPIAKVPAEKRLHHYQKTEAVFLSYDGSIIAKQYSMPVEDGMRYWIDISNTMTG